jgi:hypothetical protein
MSLAIKMAQTNSNPVRLYTRFISILKIIQYLGYFVVVFFSLIFVFLMGGTPFGVLPSIMLVPLVLQSILGCAIVYVVTQGLIAIVDLLSRIEHNTRSL